MKPSTDRVKNFPNCPGLTLEVLRTVSFKLAPVRLVSYSWVTSFVCFPDEGLAWPVTITSLTERGPVCCRATWGKTNWETQNKHRAGIAIILTRDLIVLVIVQGASRCSQQ